MKKYILISAAALIAFVGCSKIESAPEALREINFEVDKSLNTKSSVYDNGAFGTYAWYNGASSVDVFMVNEKVDKSGSVWKCVDNTYYWPKSGDISFVSYSPFNGTSNNPNTTPAIVKGGANDNFTYTISYSGVTAGTDDLMYSDMATCSSSPVPTVFRHALAKLSFGIKANFLEFTDNTVTPASTTKWKVTVTSAKLSGLKTTGDCDFTLNSNGTNWDKPATEIGTADAPQTAYIWANPTGKTDAQELIDATAYPNGVVLNASTAQDLADAAGYVLPQVLTAEAQKLELTIHITTYLPNGNTIEEDLNPTFDLINISSRKVWQINENIYYTINISPAAIDVVNPDTPQEITFDPSIADWTSISADATIQL